ncbi:hypothetical protein [Helicobacter trogontum]|nr:hypothetical protein [Helicobacter trogontum]
MQRDVVMKVDIGSRHHKRSEILNIKKQSREQNSFLIMSNLEEREMAKIQ